MNLTNCVAMNSYSNQANQQSRNGQHNRTVSLPAFSLQAAQQAQQHQQTDSLSGLGTNIASYSRAGAYGLGVTNEASTLHGWAEEEVA